MEERLKMDSNLHVELIKHWQQLRSMTYDLLEALTDEDLSLRLNFPESQALGYQFWCMLGTQESWIALLKSGKWDSWACSLDQVEGPVRRETIRAHLQAADRKLFETLENSELLEAYPGGGTALQNYLLLVEHESHHQGLADRTGRAARHPITHHDRWAARRPRDDSGGQSQELTRHCVPNRLCDGRDVEPGADRARRRRRWPRRPLRWSCDVLLGPCVNIIRTPLAGRNFETYSEDPYLAGQHRRGMGPGRAAPGRGRFAQALRLQQPGDRAQSAAAPRWTSARCARSTSRSSRPSSKETAPWTVMCSYNRINGEYASENYYLLTRILARNGASTAWSSRTGARTTPSPSPSRVGWTWRCPARPSTTAACWSRRCATGRSKRRPWMRRSAASCA
jgi:uncharacterized damage-inducible protein DinB